MRLLCNVYFSYFDHLYTGFTYHIFSNYMHVYPPEVHSISVANVNITYLILSNCVYGDNNLIGKLFDPTEEDLHGVWVYMFCSDISSI